MINVGDILSTVGVFSTMGDIMSSVGGYLEYRGRCSVPWGDIMSTVGGVQYRGGYFLLYYIIFIILYYIFIILYHLKFEYHGGYHEYRGGCSVPWGTQITKDFSPHGTHDSPHVHHDIFHGTEHPTVLKITPMVLNTPHGTQKYPPMVLMISPHGTHDILPRY